ncbi:MAG: ribosome small subunit-dependent GTPase A [Candidatus Nanopelagicales bacterium]
MSSSNKNFSEESIRFRPQKNKSRPRTKDSPNYKNLTKGIVVTVDRGRFTVVLPDFEYKQIFAIKARALGRKGVVVGDRVGLTGVNLERSEDLARIVEINERKHILRKSSDDSDSSEKILVTNASQIGIVVAIANPEPQLRFIDRALMAALDADAKPLLIITKKDLGDPKWLFELYLVFGFHIIALDQNSDLAILLQLLKDNLTVLIGASGVGKSTLVNRLAPEAKRITGEVSEVTGKGKHTSTNVYAFAISKDTWIIDSPGLRSFGLAHLSNETALAAMPELNQIAIDCPKSCTHQDQDCEIARVAERDEKIKIRFDSLKRILQSIKSDY